MRLGDLGLIGNCQYSALIENTGDVVWCCLPRFDSAPVFSTLLDEADGGVLRVAPVTSARGAMRYLDNTNVLETTFVTADGSFRIIDFAPRFVQHERMFRPTQLIRVIEPITGTPRVEARCDPRLGWTKDTPQRTRGSNHMRYEGFASQLRLTTDIPMSYMEGRSFTLTERRYLVLTWGAPIEEPLAPLCDRFLRDTMRYWERWVKDCDIPALYQQEVIRSALALKLHCFEDTGAIVAAMTTSIPEAPGSGRTWDYRYCWLRDAYYVLHAFRLLGHFEEREKFVDFLLNVAGASVDLDLSPLYRVDGGVDLEERILADWRGFGGEGPVRVGNGAVGQRQNDIYGEMVLALAPVFMDERFKRERSTAALDLLERLARKAVSVAGTPDAGIWEVRTPPAPQTFSSLMSWAAADRMGRVAQRHRPHCAREFNEAAARLRDTILATAWSEEQHSFVATAGGQNLDASLLQMAELRIFGRDDVRLRQTVDAIRGRLVRDGWLSRYQHDDGFGRPAVAFVVCTFWLVEALAVTGRVDEAREVMATVQKTLSPLGLLSEDYDPREGRMWGNFPQAYSHVGLIHAAFSASPEWSEVL